MSSPSLPIFYLSSWRPHLHRDDKLVLAGEGWGCGEGLIFINTRPLEKSLQREGKNWEFMIPFSSDNSSSTFWTIAPPGLFKALITVAGGGRELWGSCPKQYRFKCRFLSFPLIIMFFKVLLSVMFFLCWWLYSSYSLWRVRLCERNTSPFYSLWRSLSWLRWVFLLIY